MKFPRTPRLSLAVGCLALLAAPAFAQNTAGRAGGQPSSKSSPSRSPSRGAGGSPLPEPVTVALLGLGVGGVGLAVMRRRRKPEVSTAGTDVARDAN